MRWLEKLEFFGNSISKVAREGRRTDKSSRSYFLIIMWYFLHHIEALRITFGGILFGKKAILKKTVERDEDKCRDLTTLHLEAQVPESPNLSCWKAYSLLTISNLIKSATTAFHCTWRCTFNLCTRKSRRHESTWIRAGFTLVSSILDRKSVV